MRKVVVAAYSDDWKKKFDEEARELQKIFGIEILMIHHIGSTSVNGLSAKPIIDMMPVVRDITKIDTYNEAMIAIGYEPRGENGLPGRRYFQKGGDQRTHHVHMYEIGNGEIDRHIAFRDYLRMHANAAKEYADLKEALAKQFPYDIESYINGKEHLASEIEREALRWFREFSYSSIKGVEIC
ncbi:GrpB family protein [Psychrobacillus sp. NPDC096426]|uniref:GrpB family protein n=1 Tax=Psychrobacillus sp. NPDC096426 TaxID=3364491 RepID=UPI00380021D4